MGLYDGFSAVEKRNLTIYIIGIMFYKFALETLNGCMSSLVLSRIKVNPAVVWSTFLSINYAMQSIGSLLVSPLIKRWPTSRVLATAIFIFGLVVLAVPVMDLSTGGVAGTIGKGEKEMKYGDWSPYIIGFIFPMCGIFHGIVELIRRVIPRDIVGGDALKLRKMDSTVHILYEVAGTSGALLSKYWISYFGWALSLTLIPISFTLAALVWSRIENEKEKVAAAGYQSKGFIHETIAIFKSFFYSVWVGAKLVCMNRTLVWLIPAYTIPLVLHRYLENVLASQYANFAIGKGSYQQLLVAGSNFGELLGALFVLLFATAVPSPIPWLRLDAFTLLIAAWTLPLANPWKDNPDAWVWFLAATFVPVSFGWAAGDVSLVAFVQSKLSKIEDEEASVSPLGSVMSFLYVLYIIIFAIVNPWIAGVQDDFIRPLIKQFGEAKKWKLWTGLALTREAMWYTSGLFLTISAGIILLATFIPKGSFALNPQVIDDEEDDQAIAGQIAHDKATATEKERREMIKDLAA
ncbi:hypothetical protein BCR44DRAFT_1422785 [Catenaria anguillulae PL171]|uniref:Major facilitator superfamily domain-containing protein n=1 Tax=Catenaria anguillulae PL171 TaxID=765915 RepID=A0A1Y2I3H1_9FUNG|nr:hypothetical protein BCR44DRAFT_1422785 [Catenaria anguillulae PL171]